MSNIAGVLSADEIEKGWKNLDKDHDGQVPPTLQNLLGLHCLQESFLFDRQRVGSSLLEICHLHWTESPSLRASVTDNKQRDNEFLNQSSSLSSRSFSSLFTIIYPSHCEENNSHMNIYNQ